jgi:hypothetical protein
VAAWLPYSAAVRHACPTRQAKTKITSHRYVSLPKGGVCAAGAAVSNASTCFAAARTTGISTSHLANATITDATKPSGCFLLAHADGTVAATFNSAPSSVPCPSGGVRAGAATSNVNVSLNLTLDASVAGGLATLTISGPAAGWFGVGLGASAMADSPYTIIVNASGAFEQQIGSCGSGALSSAPPMPTHAFSRSCTAHTRSHARCRTLSPARVASL